MVRVSSVRQWQQYFMVVLPSFLRRVAARYGSSINIHVGINTHAWVVVTAVQSAVPGITPRSAALKWQYIGATGQLAVLDGRPGSRVDIALQVVQAIMHQF